MKFQLKGQSDDCYQLDIKGNGDLHEAYEPWAVEAKLPTGEVVKATMDYDDGWKATIEVPDGSVLHGEIQTDEENVPELRHSTPLPNVTRKCFLVTNKEDPFEGLKEIDFLELKKGDFFVLHGLGNTDMSGPSAISWKAFEDGNVVNEALGDAVPQEEGYGSIKCREVLLRRPFFEKNHYFKLVDDPSLVGIDLVESGLD